MIAVNVTETVERLRAVDGLTVVTGAPLKNHTTIKIGGVCKVLVEARDSDALMTCLKSLSQGEQAVDLFVLGGGSNLLVSDRGYDGIVLKLGEGFKRLIHRDGALTVGAAYPLKDLSSMGVREGWGGLEYFAGLPGTVGGAVKMNAGAWGKEIWDLVHSVRCVDLSGGPQVIARPEASPRYRDGGLGDDLVVTEVELVYHQERPIILKRRSKQFMMRRKKRQAVRYPTFGSVFKNPEGFHAGKLIDQVGLRGRRERGAMISEEHANFIVNVGSARAEDVLALMRLMKRVVREAYGIELETEVVLLGMTTAEREGIR